MRQNVFSARTAEIENALTDSARREGGTSKCFDPFLIQPT
jgi:hypothetical protein